MPHSTPFDPVEAEAMSCLEQGTQKLEENNLQGAKDLYKRSVEIKRSSILRSRCHVLSPQ